MRKSPQEVDGMRAAVITAPHDMEIADVEVPRAELGEVVVAVRAAGLCAADMYFYLGKIPYGAYPQVCGHEVAGIVAEVGSDVHGIKPGDPVVVEPFLGCGGCYPCRIGKTNCCRKLEIIGVHRPGGFAEFVKAPGRNIHPVPDGLPFTMAAFAEPVAIAIQVCRRASVLAAETVLVIGCGPIGLAIIEVAKSRGARVFATDVLPLRLEFAAKLGASKIPADAGLLEACLEHTHGEGFPVVIEATGNPKAMEQTMVLAAPGGRIVIAGLLKEGTGVTFPGLDFTRKEMTILGSRASVNCFPESLHLLASGAITYPCAATELSLWDAPRVFAEMAAKPGHVHKVLFLA